GITGTNGKTTVSYMLKAILEQDGRPTGLIGSIRHFIGRRIEVSNNTTPDAVDLQRFLAEMVDENMGAAVMEVSSHALAQGRVDEIDFQTGVFTNLSREHLDYHRSMEAYGRAKALLFSKLSPAAAAVINADDPAGIQMIEASTCPVIRYGFSPGAEVTAIVRRLDVDGFSLILKTPSGDVDITSRLPGRFNVVNAMAAAAAALSLGVPLSAVKSGFETLRCIDGRMESIDCGQDFRVIVDYAHTPDALENILLNLRPLTKGRLITVFGCGGDRDRTKRPLMAEAVTLHSTHAFITSDNPRTEDPSDIIDDILQGVIPEGACEVEPDRRRAIEKAIAQAKGGDIVVIAGKGHENYQILKDGTVDFDDRQIVKETLWNQYR
ncbi:MAG: UDP-N-acetylmuramoyl-L-alanyl-D-glutamate--2,6-diaminopimelate ligase, partial [Planctomycetes bacterium]|nr:UDP-N-acetylmuramoyl-L-alanyl-D-glutamate--2,6-diaminopimelate ligase [Planctomycetota bacterium]